MKRRTILVLGILLVLGAGACLLFLARGSDKHRGLAHGTRSAGPGRTATSSIPVGSQETGEDEELRPYPPAVAARLDKRFRELETMGAVPTNGSPDDWQMAQQASWWGKRIDPRNFWKGRVVWLDATAVRDAHAMGRSFPPIPPGADTSWLGHFQQEEIGGAGGRSVDDSGPSWVLNASEANFWNHWSQTHPRPPSDIAEAQLELADRNLLCRFDYEHRGNPYHDNEARLKEGERVMRGRKIGEGNPPEALTDTALFWCYVQHKREEYQARVQDGRETAGELSKSFREGLYVDPSYITRELTPQEIQEANAWKLAYLNRLVSENTDRSYIDAYVKAWNLDASLLTNAPAGSGP